MIREYSIIKDLARVCEFVYRKGVADAASYGDREAVMGLADREDFYTTMKFLSDNHGMELKPEAYRDFLTVCASQIKANYFRNFMIYEPARTDLKNSMATLADYMYRLGLKDGVHLDRNKGLSFFHSVGTGSSHKKADGTGQDEISFIQEIKYFANKIHSARVSQEIPSRLNRLAIFIGDAVMLSRLDYGDDY